MINSVFAATTGKLAGKIRDANGDPVAFANIVLEGENRGIRSDENGRYYLKRIEPGTYSLICSKMGYDTHKMKQVKINLDETTVINFELQRSALEVPGITISEAKYKLVDKLKTSSGNAITQVEIEEVDVGEVEDLIALQAGAIVNNGELHIRGGRMNEVVYVVDGICVTDVVDGLSALAVDVDAIAEMKVMTGGFPAEYGNAQSGIINIITKSGGDRFSGKLAVSSDFITDYSNNEIVKFNLGGPLNLSKYFQDKLRFNILGKMNLSDTFLKSEFGNNAYDESAC